MGLHYKIDADIPAPPVPTITFTVYLATAEETDPHSIRVTWATGGQSTGIIQYGTSPTALSTTVTDGILSRYHNKTITGLLTDQEYYFKITATFFSGDTASTDVGVFYLSPLIAPLAIEKQLWGQVSPTEVDIMCDTNRLTTAVLHYGTTSISLVNTITHSTPSRYHNFPITGLTTDQEYYYQIIVTDSNSSTVTADVDDFYLSPLISPLTIEIEAVGHFVRGVETFSSATIECITNRLTTIRVDYGTSSGSLSHVLTDAVFSRYHAIAIGSLILEQTIYYQIIATDSNGDTATSSIDTFCINGVPDRGYPLNTSTMIATNNAV
jgi:hypothetical protein